MVSMGFFSCRRCWAASQPKDSTPEEVERARLLAIESRRKLDGVATPTAEHVLLHKDDSVIDAPFTDDEELYPPSMRDAT